jgi:IS30 family transposase
MRMIKPLITQQQIDNALALYKDGYCNADIAKNISVHTSSVYRLLIRHKLTPNRVSGIKFSLRSQCMKITEKSQNKIMIPGFDRDTQDAKIWIMRHESKLDIQAICKKTGLSRLEIFKALENQTRLIEGLYMAKRR